MATTIVPIVALLLGTLCGGCVVAFLFARRVQTDADHARKVSEDMRAQHADRLELLQQERARLEQEYVQARTSLTERQRQVEERDEQLRRTTDQLHVCSTDLEAVRRTLGDANESRAKLEQRANDYAAREAEIAALRVALATTQGALAEEKRRTALLEQQVADDERLAEEKLNTLRAAQTQMEETFKGIAAQVLQQNTEKFEASTKLRLGELLQPLGERIKEFETKVQDTHKRDIEDRSTLHAELKRIVSTSQKLDQDALNLTKALKGDSKVQGAWGEVVLERVLEQSGLREGIEYVQQQSFKNDDGQCQRPDVIVHLPGQRDVVVDAKVSLTAYEAYCSSASDEDRAACLSRHVESVRAHVKALSDKEYWRLQEVHTPDFVLMFVPIESAFIEALRCDPSLFEHAFRQRIVLTSPTTLLAVLKTIEHAWHVERHNESAREIVRQAGALYDKLRGFVDDLQQVGARLGQAQSAYDGALGKLSRGKGNVIARAEKLRELGVKVKKELPSELTGELPEVNERIAQLGDPIVGDGATA